MTPLGHICKTRHIRDRCTRHLRGRGVPALPLPLLVLPLALRWMMWLGVAEFSEPHHSHTISPSLHLSISPLLHFSFHHPLPYISLNSLISHYLPFFLLRDMDTGILATFLPLTSRIFEPGALKSEHGTSRKTVEWTAIEGCRRLGGQDRHA